MFDRYYREAIKVAERLGTWVLYEVRDARDLDHLVGYLSYTVDDLDALRARATATKRARYSQLVGFWRRAIRWVSSLDRERYQEIAAKLIEHMERHPEHSKLAYYVKDAGHRTLNANARPQRRAGRPRTRPSAEKRVRECVKCSGLGFMQQQ